MAAWIPLAREIVRRAAAAPQESHIDAAQVRRVIFVCHGNIMRSAFAAAYWEQRIDSGISSRLPACSAGTDARQGRAAHDRAVEGANSLGVDLGRHQATPLASMTLAAGDLLVGFDCENVVLLKTRAAQTTNVQVLLLGDLDELGGTLDAEVRDPWGTSAEATQGTFQRITRLIDRLELQLRP